MKSTVLLLVSLTLLSSCAATGAADCGAWRPILVADADVLTDGEKAEMKHETQMADMEPTKAEPPVETKKGKGK